MLQVATHDFAASDSAPGRGRNDSVSADTQSGQTPPPQPPPPTAEPSIVPLTADVRTVSTALELQQAVMDGVRDIEVVEHLDLRDLQLLNNPYNHRPEGKTNKKATNTMYTDTLTRSIRVCFASR
jgi:hypothetical protein